MGAVDHGELYGTRCAIAINNSKEMTPLCWTEPELMDVDALADIIAVEMPKEDSLWMGMRSLEDYPCRLSIEVSWH